MCQEGRISGAAKLEREWVILDNAESPEDGRVLTLPHRMYVSS